MSLEQVSLVPSADILSVGQRLRERRLALGWSIEQTSSRIKYSVRQITLLEQDRYTELPGGATLKGMVRNYARALDLPAEPLLQKLSPELTAPVPLTRPVGASLGTMPGERSAMLPVASRGVWSRLGLPLVVAVLLIVAGFAFLVPGVLDMLRPDAPAPASVQPAPVQEGEPAAEPAATDPVSVPAPSEPVGAPTGDAPSPAAPAEPSTPVPSSVAPAAPPPTAATPVVTPPVATGGGTLELVAREESWVEVRDAPGGAVLFSRLMTAGARERLNLSSASVLVGNAGGMEVRWNGSTVDLSTLQRNNVARINLP